MIGCDCSWSSLYELSTLFSSVFSVWLSLTVVIGLFFPKTYTNLACKVLFTGIYLFWYFILRVQQFWISCFFIFLIPSVYCNYTSTLWSSKLSQWQVCRFCSCGMWWRKRVIAGSFRISVPALNYRVWYLLANFLLFGIGDGCVWVCLLFWSLGSNYSMKFLN
jgi:hypothetical protein